MGNGIGRSRRNSWRGFSKSTPVSSNSKFLRSPINSGFHRPISNGERFVKQTLDRKRPFAKSGENSPGYVLNDRRQSQEVVLGEKLNALFESKIHRKDAVILPKPSEIARSYKNGNSALDYDQNWVRLSFNGGTNHRKWMKDQKRVGMGSSTSELDRSSGSSTSSMQERDYFKLPYQSSSSVGPERNVMYMIRNNPPKLRKKRPKAITNWLKDLEVLISSDDSIDDIFAEITDTSPTFSHRTGKQFNKESPDQVKITELRESVNSQSDKQYRSLGDYSATSSNTSKSNADNHNSQPHGVKPNGKSRWKSSYLMGATTSCRGPKVLPTLPRTIKLRRQKDAERKKNSSTSSSGNMISDDHGRQAKSSSVHSGLETDDSSDDESISSNDITEKIRRRKQTKHARRSRDRSNSNRFRSKNHETLETPDSYKELRGRASDMRERRNFEQALRTFTPDVKHSISRKLLQSNIVRKNSGNFLLSSSYNHFKDSETDDGENPETIGRPQSSFTNYGFDPYIDASVYESKIRQNQNKTQYRHNRTRKLRYKGGSSSDSSHDSDESESNISSLPQTNESDSSSPHSTSRLWRKNDLIMSSLNSFHHYVSPYQKITRPIDRNFSSIYTGPSERSLCTSRHMFNGEQPRHQLIDRQATNSITSLPPEVIRDLSNRGRFAQHQQFNRERNIAKNSIIGPRARLAYPVHFKQRQTLSFNDLSNPNPRRQTALLQPNSRRHQQSRERGQIDPRLQQKMDAMVKSMIYSGQVRRRGRDAVSQGRNTEVNLNPGDVPKEHQSNKRNPALDAIHGRVASALASVIIAKTFPNQHKEK